MADETQKTEFEARVAALVDEARERGLDDHALTEVLSEMARKLREGQWRSGPVI